MQKGYAQINVHSLFQVAAQSLPRYHVHNLSLLWKPVNSPFSRIKVGWVMKSQAKEILSTFMPLLLQKKLGACLMTRALQNHMVFVRAIILHDTRTSVNDFYDKNAI